MSRRSKTPKRKRVVKRSKSTNRRNTLSIILWFVGLIVSGIEYNSQYQSTAFIKVIAYLMLTLLALYIESKCKSV